MHHEPRQAYDNLRKLQRNLGAYGEGGFYDAIAVKSGKVAQRYLSLDQAMMMGSIGNVFGAAVRRAFAAAPSSAGSGRCSRWSVPPQHHPCRLIVPARAKTRSVGADRRFADGR